MLEKIGLPPKPSLRGSSWVVDASHCQGCSSQFTFINRKWVMMLDVGSPRLISFDTRVLELIVPGVHG
ncbi:UNVERIFIED_CONTAM: hypothetical protein Sangu_1145600 [Sesamum angustifolium]|uniref:Uncharacterized protein n=2 Tax=Sesamum TaxID=4181 RepID=A0AAE1X6C5_9LAMI|nr:hypothetical protein Sango_0616800 [Sesamum angolense]